VNDVPALLAALVCVLPPWYLERTIHLDLMQQGSDVRVPHGIADRYGPEGFDANIGAFGDKV
jgi:hypothetical protein